MCPEQTFKASESGKLVTEPGSSGGPSCFQNPLAHICILALEDTVIQDAIQKRSVTKDVGNLLSISYQSKCVPYVKFFNLPAVLTKWPF